MNKTNCITVDDHTIIVEKDGIQDIVYYVGNSVFVAQPHTLVKNHRPFIPWAKVLDSEASAKEEWFRVVGKLIKRDADSKYFKNPKTEEHLNNGGELTDDDRKHFEVMVENVIDNCQAHKINI